MIGEVLDGRYQVTQVLSQGGFGVTFLALDTKRPKNPICVVKKLQPQFSDPSLLEIARRKFYQEAEILETLGKHDRIPRLLAYFEENGEFYLVQEYIDGHTLAKELIPGQPLQEDRVINILSELLEILDFVHGNNVIHRDIKPQNIIRRKQDDKLVLIDFGAVKEVTAQGSPPLTMGIGTGGYMPLEQFNGRPVYASDIYAVGIIAIQAMTGINPNPHVANGGFDTDDDDNEIVWRNKGQVSDALGDFLTKMVRHNYRERYLSAKEALLAVNKIGKDANETTFIRPQPPQPSFLKKLFIFVPGCLAVGILVAVLMKGVEPSDSLPLIIQSSFDSGDSPENPLDKRYSERHPFQGSKGQKVTIEMFSDEVDSSLVLLAPDGSKLDVSDDISPDNFNAKIVVTLPEDGKYIIIARSSQGELGSYSLRAAIINDE